MQVDQMVFEGTEEEQRLAREVWMAMRMLGASFADNAPIRQPLSALAGYFGRRPPLQDVADPIAVLDATLAKNSAVFAREVTDDGVVRFVTTRAGKPPAGEAADTRHTFRVRLTEPEPVKEVERPALVAPVPTRISEVWLRPPETPVGVQPEEAAAAPVEAEAAPAAVEPVAAPAEAAAVPAEAPAKEVVEAAPLVEEPLAAGPGDLAALRAAIQERLAGDPRVVSFGDEWFLDDQTMRLSRGDFRRIRDYLIERGEPLADETLLGDVFGRRVSERDYGLWRFGLNLRLSKEKRDFEFVGTGQSRLWSASGLPALGSTKRKPAEIGQDYRFLLETAETAPPDAAGAASLDHTLTFYEYEYGVLPLDARLAAFFPPAFLEDQRAAVLRFDVPQLYTSYLVELRYPTANRGGFIGGLEQFYAENLVPGAVLTIERTDNDGRYVVRFAQISGEERRLLHVDERRGRYVFRPVTFYCAVNEDMVLSDSKFPRLNNAKPLEDRERRRPEVVARVTFERVGEQVGQKDAPRYYALFDDLLAAANVERPFTAGYLREVLESESHPEFTRDAEGDAYHYDPALAQ